jgi:Phage tail tube protein
MANNCVAGDCFVKFDGRQLSVRGSVTISPNTRTRTGVAGLDGVHGFRSENRVPYIEVEATNRKEVPLTDLAKVVDSTVTAELETGEVWVLRNAWQAADLELAAAEGTVTIRFEGLQMTRQLSAAA